jgi:hypothetical protein
MNRNKSNNNKSSNKVVEHKVRYAFDGVNHFACTDPLNIGCNENVSVLNGKDRTHKCSCGVYSCRPCMKEHLLVVHMATE